MVKILVSGDVEGRFTQLFKRVTQVQKKAGSFDLLFCVGNFFGPDNSEWRKYVSGELKVPISTLILGPNKGEDISLYGDENGGDLCPNVTYLGKRGLYTEASGLTVAYLSGIDGLTSESIDNHQFNSHDVNAVRVPLTAESSFKGVDILLTSCWPNNVDKYASTVEGFDCSKCGSSAVSQLSLSIKPRYHFCALQNLHYERQPYRNHRILADKEKHTTRFIALGKVGNSNKFKYLYAFNIDPMSKMADADLTKQPSDVTECPYKLDNSIIQAPNKKQDSDGGGTQFFYDPKMLDGQSMDRKQKRKRHHNDRDHKGEKRQPKQPMGPCWFCLGSPEVEKHLVISVGDHSYMALAKGGLTEEHILIAPITHEQSTTVASKEVVEEIERFKSALRACFKQNNKVMVFYERNYKTQHLQVQGIPIPNDYKVDIKETFERCAENENIELAEIPRHSDLRQIIPEGVPYFYVELPTGDKMFCRISKGFPLNFGREAIADNSILNIEHKIDWRNCKSTREEEEQDTKIFREKFNSFDFNN